MEDPLVSTKIVDMALRCLSDGSSVNKQGPVLASNQAPVQPPPGIAPTQATTPPPMVFRTPPPVVSRTPPPMVSRTPPPMVSRTPPPMASRTQASAPMPDTAPAPAVSPAIHSKPSTLQSRSPLDEWEDIERWGALPYSRSLEGFVSTTGSKYR